jgi:hypothetical protein
VSRRVLVVAYYFPPLGGVGVQRTLKYVKYLPDNGWQPVVLTPAKPAYTFRDETLLDRLAPDLQVERTASFEPARLPNAVAARLSRPARGVRFDSCRRRDTRVPRGSGMPARMLSKGYGALERLLGRPSIPRRSGRMDRCRPCGVASPCIKPLPFDLRLLHVSPPSQAT